MNTKRGAVHVAEPAAAYLARPLPAIREQAPAEFWRAAASSLDTFEGARYAAAVSLGDRLTQARKATKLSRADVAEQLHVHENTVGKFERGETVPDVVQLVQLGALYLRTPSWLLGAVAIDTPPEPARAAEAVEHGEYIFVPLFDVYASAGHGTFESSEAVEAMRPFTTAYIRQHLDIRHDRMAMVRVMGNSMEPEIHSGDIVLVDRADCGVVVEGPHLVRLDGSLLLKVLQRRPGNRIRVASRNTEYEPFEVPLGDAKADFEVLGRVRWAGVTFR